MRKRLVQTDTNGIEAVTKRLTAWQKILGKADTWTQIAQ